MSDHHSSQAPFRELMSAIGYLMFHWSVLEHELGEEISRLRSISGDLTPSGNRLRSTPSERIAEWQALQSRLRRRDKIFQQGIQDLAERIQTLARFRNLVTHGFVTADGGENESVEPWIVCSSANSGLGVPDTRLTLSHLKDAIQQMIDCRTRLSELGPDHR